MKRERENGMQEREPQLKSNSFIEKKDKMN